MLDTKIIMSEVEARIDYDPNTGIFSARYATARISKGQCLVHKGDGGYVYVSIRGRKVPAHRLAWLIQYGYWPKNIDHINRIKTDNRIDNLRECNAKENKENIVSANRNNKTGFRGVSMARGCKNRFIAVIHSSGKQVVIGRFQTAIEAHEAYLKAKKSIHPFFSGVK